MEEFLTKLDPSLYAASQISIRQVLEKESFNDKIINQLASAACLTMYGQSIEIDGLVGIVSLCGAIGELWSVKNGNKQIPEKLLELSGANVLKNTKVKVIGKSKNSPILKNSIVYQTNGEDEILDDNFDFVVISFPITKDTIGENFQLDFDSKNDFSSRQMQKTNAYFINGVPKLFPNLPSNKLIDLLAVDPNIAYRSVRAQLPCDYEKKKDKDFFSHPGSKLYKVFSEIDFDSSNFDQIFENGYKTIDSYPWLAYPKYDKNNQVKTMPNVVLDSMERSRVLYANSMEWSSSCMEICSISARNVALLIANKEEKLVNKRNKRFFQNPKIKSTYLDDKNVHKICKYLTFSSIFLMITLYLSQKDIISFY